MNELTKAILSRRSVRQYTGEHISDEKLHAILQAGLLAPTGMNKKACQFYVVRNKKKLEELSKAKKTGATFLAHADAAIAVFCDASETDTWVEDCSIALSYMHLMAASLDIGSCWCQMHLRSSQDGADTEQNARDVVHVSSNYCIVGILALGMPSHKPKPHTIDDADWTKVHVIE